MGQPCCGRPTQPRSKIYAVNPTATLPGRATILPPSPKQRLLSRDRTFVQPLDGIQRRQNCTFLPGREPRTVFACQNDAVIDGAHIVVVLGAPLIRPAAGTAQGERHAVPGDG